MSYSIDIYRIEKDTETDFYSAVPIEFYPGSPSIPDSYIRSIRIDDLSIDPVNFFAIVGRKCKIEMTMYGELGWFTEFSHSRESHPDYIEWFPFIFVVKKEMKPIFIGGLKKQNYSLNELNSTESMYLSMHWTFSLILPEKRISLNISRVVSQYDTVYVSGCIAKMDIYAELCGNRFHG